MIIYHAYSYLYMVLVVLLKYIIAEKIVVGVYIMALVSSPLHILFLSSKTFPVVHQAQYEVYTVLLRFGDNIV